MSDSCIDSEYTNLHINMHPISRPHSPNTHGLDTDDELCVYSFCSIATTNELPEVLAWLSPIESHIRHQLIRMQRADSVGERLLQSDEFQRWYHGVGQDGLEYRTLFCWGGPAVGKTFFSSLVVDMLCDKVGEENIAVACLYVDFAAREEQTPTNMLGSLLKQIVGGLERIPDEICQIFQDCKRVSGGRGLRVPEIVKMLQTVTSLQPTFLCIDALDQCEERHRLEVLESLRQILSKSPNTRIFLTGREHIRGEIERHLGRRVAILSIKPNNDDIVAYIHMRLSEDISPDAMDTGLEAEIIGSITAQAPETFLIISLTIDAILRETTAYGMRRRLKVIEDGLNLDGVYGETLERIKDQGGQKARLAMAALMWISHSERLLQPDELVQALAVEIGSTYLDPKNIPSVEILLNSCLGLVVVHQGGSTIRLIHFTLLEYLNTCPDLFGAAHSTIAKTCLTYLNFRVINEIPSTTIVPPQSTPFLKYASLYWGAHARRKVSEDVVSLALHLFSQIESHISTRLLLVDLLSKIGPYNREIPVDSHLVGFTGLHCASVFGIVEIATDLLGQPNCHHNQRDFLGITPLIWAAICGRNEVAKILLEQQSVIPDKPDDCYRRTGLSWAARQGHEEMVRLFLGWTSSNPDGTDGWWGKTPRVMNTFLRRRYINPNKPDMYGQTPISLAVEEGHEGVLKLLLGRKDVRPGAADRYGRTPLFLASSTGQEGLVKLFVERKDISINRPDENGNTPLLSAIDREYEGVVGLLLGRRDVKPDVIDKDGETPLMLVVKKGHEGLVKLLLARKDVDPGRRGKCAWTPLSWASWVGHEGVVKLLLDRPDINPNTPDKTDQTPLSRASSEGHEGVVKLLLERKDINPNAANRAGQTPLSLASRNKHGAVVQLLQDRKYGSSRTE